MFSCPNRHGLSSPSLVDFSTRVAWTVTDPRVGAGAAIQHTYSWGRGTEGNPWQWPPVYACCGGPAPGLVPRRPKTFKPILLYQRPEGSQESCGIQTTLQEDTQYTANNTQCFPNNTQCIANAGRSLGTKDGRSACFQRPHVQCCGLGWASIACRVPTDTTNKRPECSGELCGAQPDPLYRVPCGVYGCCNGMTVMDQVTHPLTVPKTVPMAGVSQPSGPFLGQSGHAWPAFNTNVDSRNFEKTLNSDRLMPEVHGRLPEWNPDRLISDCLSRTSEWNETSCDKSELLNKFPEDLSGAPECSATSCGDKPNLPNKPTVGQSTAKVQHNLRSDKTSSLHKAGNIQQRLTGSDSALFRSGRQESLKDRPLSVISTHDSLSRNVTSLSEPLLTSIAPSTTLGNPCSENHGCTHPRNNSQNQATSRLSGHPLFSPVVSLPVGQTNANGNGLHRTVKQNQTNLGAGSEIRRALLQNHPLYPDALGTSTNICRTVTCTEGLPVSNNGEKHDATAITSPQGPSCQQPKLCPNSFQATQMTPPILEFTSTDCSWQECPPRKPPCGSFLQLLYSPDPFPCSLDICTEPFPSAGMPAALIPHPTTERQHVNVKDRLSCLQTAAHTNVNDKMNALHTAPPLQQTLTPLRTAPGHLKQTISALHTARIEENADDKEESGNRKYKCLYCNVICNNSGQLKGHLRVHTGERPYRCECGRAFARNEELTRHRRIHSGLRPHQCSTCGKRFGRKDHLNKHQKTHLRTSEKKVYACQVDQCRQRYTRSDALARHQWGAHGIRAKTSRLQQLVSGV